MVIASPPPPQNKISPCVLCNQQLSCKSTQHPTNKKLKSFSQKDNIGEKKKERWKKIIPLYCVSTAVTNIIHTQLLRGNGRGN